MTVELMRAVLGWCVILNMGLLLFWWLMMVCAADWVYQMHRHWFKLERPVFDAIHYAGMMGYKLAIFFLGVVPYLALRIAG